MRPILTNHVAFAPRRPRQDRGYHRLIVDGGPGVGVRRRLERHREYERECPGLGLMAWNPGGRDPERRKLLIGPRSTSMRSDQIQRAWAQGWGWVVQDLMEERRGQETETTIYVGSYPHNVGLRETGLDAMLRLGYEEVFDALSTHRRDTRILREVDARWLGGRQVMTEANHGERRTGKIPAMGYVPLWRDRQGLWAQTPQNRRRTFPKPVDGWWYRGTIDGPWSLSRARAALGYRMRLFVDLDELSLIERRNLFALVKEHHEAGSTDVSDRGDAGGGRSGAA